MRSAERLAQSVKAACSGHDVVIIASSDLVHYVPKPYADEMDSMFMDAVASGDVSSVYRLVEKERLSVCGYGPIAVAMMLSGGRIEVLDRTDSFESIGYDRNSVVGYGSAARDARDKTVLELVPPQYRRKGLFPAGRLDKDTTGLMILTDDGALAHEILAPKLRRFLGAPLIFWRKSSKTMS